MDNLDRLNEKLRTRQRVFGYTAYLPSTYTLMDYMPDGVDYSAVQAAAGEGLQTDIDIASADKDLEKQAEAVEKVFNEVSADLADANGGKGLVIATVFPKMTPKATGFFPLAVNLRNLMPGRTLKFWPSVSYFHQHAQGKTAVSLAAGAEGDFFFLDEAGNPVSTVSGDASKMTVVPHLTAGKDYTDAFITADATAKDQEALKTLKESAMSVNNTTTPTSDKDGGGCDSGFGVLAALAAVGMIARKRR